MQEIVLDFRNQEVVRQVTDNLSYDLRSLELQMKAIARSQGELERLIREYLPQVREILKIHFDS